MKKILIFAMSFICTFAYADTGIIVSQEKAWEILKNNILGNKCENINVYVNTSVITANSQIATYGKEEISPDTNSWLFFVDDLPNGNWSHPCRYIYVDCESGRVITHNHTMPPSGMDLKTIIEQKINTDNLLYDSKKMKESSQKTIITNSTLKSYASSKDYAVIINGGINYQNNHIRYWNDCAAIYSTLINVYGYNKNHIFVLMSDGTNPAIDRNTGSGYDSSPLDLDNDGTNDIQYSATRNNVINVLNQLSYILTNDNNLFIYTMDHGDIYNNHSYLCLWNNEKIYDYEFANYLSNINASSINICMGQCHSGGFIDDLSNNKYVIATACKFNEVSYALNNSYDAFVYYWTAAVTGAYPNGVTVNADINGDGYISMREAFNFANSMDNKPETPQFAYTPSGADTRINLFMENPDVILGDCLISTTKEYNIPNLPSGVTVSWSLDDDYYNTGYNLLLQNYPSANRCTIVHTSAHDLDNATLTATIKYNGTPVWTVTKSGIYSYDGFRGQYTSGTLSGNIPSSLYFNIKANTTTTVTSANFYGATVTYGSGATPTAWAFNPSNGVLNFKAPAGSTPVVINVHDVCGNNYTLYAMPSSYSINVSNGESGITVTLVEDGNASKDSTPDESWTLEIINAATGQVMATQSSKNRSETISTVGWPKGIYIVKVIIGKEELTEKIMVK